MFARLRDGRRSDGPRISRVRHRDDATEMLGPEPPSRGQRGGGTSGWGPIAGPTTPNAVRHPTRVVAAPGPAPVGVLVATEGPHGVPGHVIRLYAGENLIGRGDHLPDRIPDLDLTISRHHARVAADAYGATIEPLAERHVWLDGREIAQPTPLRDGARVELGCTVFVFRAIAGD